MAKNNRDSKIRLGDKRPRLNGKPGRPMSIRPSLQGEMQAKGHFKLFLRSLARCMGIAEAELSGLSSAAVGRLIQAKVAECIAESRAMALLAKVPWGKVIVAALVVGGAAGTAYAAYELMPVDKLSVNHATYEKVLEDGRSPNFSSEGEDVWIYIEKNDRSGETRNVKVTVDKNGFIINHGDNIPPDWHVIGGMIQKVW